MSDLEETIKNKIEQLEESVEKKETNNQLTEFFSLLLGSKLIGHIHHLKTKGKGSYAKHKALDDFYAEAGEIADKIIEIYQGYSKKLVEFDSDDLVFGINEETIDYLEDLRFVVNAARDFDELKFSNMQNEIDNFLSLIDQTVYKLTFLE